MMSQEQFEKEISDAFLYLGSSLIEVNVLFYSESNFGNAMAKVNSSLGKFKITRERGLTFIDVMIPGKGYIRAEDISKAVMVLQEKGGWTLLEQLQKLVNVSHS
jgi:hypothetical protein